MGGLSSVASGGARVMWASARIAALGATVARVAVRTRSISKGGCRARDRARLLRDGCQAILRNHGIEAVVDGVPPIGPALLACNHVSWLDPIVVAAHAPCAPISKLEMRGWPVFGSLAGGLGVIFYNRGDRRSGMDVLRACELALRNQVALLNFPEGTTTDGASVGPFHKGLFGLAQRLGVPVVPVALRYEPADLAWIGDATFMPHYLKMASRGRSRVRLRFGEPVQPGLHASASQLAVGVRERVVALLEAA